MPRVAALCLLSVAISLSTTLPVRAQSATCTVDSDRCEQEHGSVLAIAHSYTAPETTVLLRVKVAAWSPGTKWGDGHNGFFYRATARHAGGATTVTTYTPFNGVRVGTDGQPALPAFDFIVPVDVSDGGTILEIAACSSDPDPGSGSSLQCAKPYWTDSYDPLPAPAVTPNPPVSVSFSTLTLGGSGAVSLADSGVYTDHLELRVDPSLTQAQLEWLFDHLVFFDAQGDAYVNDVIGQGIGVLTLGEAAYVSPQDQRYHTKYGTGDAVSESLAPNEQLFFYTTLVQETKIGITVIYDQTDVCTGYIANNGSRNINCSFRGPAAPSINPQVTVSGNAWKPDSASVTGTVAGSQQRRSVQLQVDTAITDTGANCRPVLSPLALAPNAAGGAQRPPSYVIDDVDWTRRFPNGLYYLLDAGFGNCDLSAAAPFCEQTSGYVGYIPHYLADGVGGTLNGGSNSGPEVTAMDLADEYGLGNIGTAAQNALVFFDGCGYGHRYEEPNVNVSLGTRKPLPAAPDGWTRLAYTVENVSGRAVVFAKECCASWYQPNDQTGQNEPVQQLDDGFGMFLPIGASVAYESIFADEAMAVYDAATGEPLFKLRLEGSNSIVHSCSDPSSSVVVSGSGSTFTLKIGATGSGAKKCQSIGKCPLALTASQSGSLVSCTATKSSFLFGLNDWKAQAKLPNAIQLRAYGGTGRDAKSGDGAGGAHGVALTVMRPNDLPDALYAYCGETGDNHGDGGSSSILTRTPLSLYGQDVGESTINPADMNVLLIAGGGGGDGTKHDGGNSPPAFANSSSVPGAAVSLPGQDGFNDNGGKGGNKDGQGAGGSTAGKDGVGGTSHGTGADWNKTGPLIPPTVDPLDWTGAGHGAHGNDSAGGGGFGGGGHGSTNAAGGGGGGSWAAGNTAHDSTVPTGRPASPGGDNGGVGFNYVAPTAAVAPAALSTSSASLSSGAALSSTGAAPRNVVRLTYDASVTPLDVGVVVEKLLGSGIGGDVPVHLEAWGGAGGIGGTDGGSGGASGYARASFLLADLLAMTADNGLYVYVGEPGAGGEQRGDAGQGGASSIVSTRPLEDGATSPRESGVLLVSAGGGGGGGGSATDDPTAQPGGGGAGGVAIATVEADARSGGADGGAVVDGEAVGGGGGDGGGGSAGAVGGSQGSAGIGGFGGVSGANRSVPGWLDADVASWNAGQGAASSTLGGGGGGGFGGGGSGGEAASRGEGGGGGGGGSWARQSTVQDDDAPILGPLNPSATNGAIALTFDLCKVHPGSRLCMPGASFSEIHPRVRTFDDGGGILRIRIEGHDSLDVSAIDTGRLLFGHTMVEPLQVSEPADVDGNGVADLELLIQAGNLSTGPEEVLHCLYGALGATPFVGCSRVEAAACDECSREECINDVCGGCIDEPCSGGGNFGEDDGCAIAGSPHTRAPTGSFLLPLFGFILMLARRRAARAAALGARRGRGGAILAEAGT